MTYNFLILIDAINVRVIILKTIFFSKKFNLCQININTLIKCM